MLLARELSTSSQVVVPGGPGHSQKLRQEVPCRLIALLALAFVLQDFDLEFSGPGWDLSHSPHAEKSDSLGGGNEQGS